MPSSTVVIFVPVLLVQSSAALCTLGFFFCRRVSLPRCFYLVVPKPVGKVEAELLAFPATIHADVLAGKLIGAAPFHGV